MWILKTQMEIIGIMIREEIHRKINGTESNGTGSRIQEGGKYPDTEDLDRSTFLDKTNDYFSSNFLLTDTTYLAGITKNNTGPTGWRLFRVPLSDFKKYKILNGMKFDMFDYRLQILIH